MKSIRGFLLRFWPKRLMGQTVLLVLIALFSAQIISALIIRSDAREFYRGAEQRFLAERIAPLASLMRDTSPELREKLATAMSNRRLKVWAGDAAINADSDARDSESVRTRELAARIAAELGTSHSTDVRVFRHRHSNEDNDRNKSAQLVPGALKQAGLPRHTRYRSTVVSLSLGDGQWMNAALKSRQPRRLFRSDTWGTFLVTALAISIIVVIALRRITKPLGALSDAAGKLGRGEEIEPLAEEGPSDVRDAIRAFNQMQDRLNRFVTERTKMLAAISHDLRTPITSLRLRAEMLEDDEAREKMIETLTDMQDMVEATLAFAREEAADEPTRPADLAALLDAITEDLRQHGHDIELEASALPAYPCRPLALRRALTNLIQNAATYGKQARITLVGNNSAPDIVIEDRGPGIPESEMERIFEPFVRLDASRSTETGGIGLGMSIARDIIRRHGGDITLKNMGQGGLRVTVSLPDISG